MERIRDLIRELWRVANCRLALLKIRGLLIPFWMLLVCIVFFTVMSVLVLFHGDVAVFITFIFITAFLSFMTYLLFF